MQFILLPQLNKHVDCLFAVYHVTSVTVHNDVGYKHLDLLTYLLNLRFSALQWTHQTVS